ncbi:spermatid perinuclear RNA-binding protein-like isoform X1 [Macrobrachium rosenbergii]|uniref:spermatid perinuclear RNA-binding protein-like isoform X1 n=1 Tax=Macrobrachium rosenbergii TaxID=79674 RepID=UPI0034D4F1DB
MEGNGYYPENDQGFGDGWGNNNRRNTSAQGGLYGNEPFMQRGLYDYSTSSYGGDMGGGQRLTGYGGNRMSSSNMYGSEMGSQRMPYGFGDMDMQNPSSQRDMSYGNTGSFSSMDQTGRRTFDDYDGSGMQNSFKQRGGESTGAQKRMLSDYESDVALMQGGSYAGSSPFGKDSAKRRGLEEEDYPASQQGGGNFSSFGQKGQVSYKAVAPPEVGPFSYEYDQPATQKRPFGFQGFNSGARNSFMFDDRRYRLGSGGAGRGRGMQRNVGGEWQNKGMKRSDPGFKQGGPYPKKKKNPLQGQKNPVSFLNEIRPDAKFNVSDMEGPSNMPTFRVSLEFDGETYTASAKSKKLAKRFAAEAALRVYLQTPTAIQLGYSESMIEFSDGAEEAVTQGNDVESDKKTNTTATKPSTDEAALGGKNPVMYLNELRKDVAYDLKEETGQAHNKNFIMRVTVSGQEFEGSGQSKKLARAAAALEALKGLGLMNKISPITQDNKGYQMLQKMGWNGTGLGAKEQGITNCIEPVKY